MVDPLDWMPGLHHEDLTLREVLSTLPGDGPDVMPAMVRRFESPGSRWALPGAIALPRHDALHVLLGRGMRNEDEAFVIGFTMGASDGVENAMTKILRVLVRIRHPTLSGRQLDQNLRSVQIWLYIQVSRYAYRPPYTFRANDRLAYQLGLGLGERTRVRNPEQVPFESLLDQSIKSLRAKIGVRRLDLEAIYRVERQYSSSAEGLRLDTDQVDHAYIHELAGPPSNWVREPIEGGYVTRRWSTIRLWVTKRYLRIKRG